MHRNSSRIVCTVESLVGMEMLPEMRLASINHSLRRFITALRGQRVARMLAARFRSGNQHSGKKNLNKGR